MAKYSDWRDDLREVMDDEVDDKKVKEKKVNNAKLIKINPKLGEAVEELGGHIVEVSELEDKQSDKEFEDDADVKKAEQNKKKEDQLKKRIIRMKLRGLNQGSGDTLVAHNEPEGELVEASPALAANTKIKNKDDRKKKEKEYARLISILAHQKDLKKRGLSSSYEPEGDIVEGDVHSGQGEKIQKRTKKWMDKKGQSGAPGLNAMNARTAEHKAKRGVKVNEADDKAYKYVVGMLKKKYGNDAVLTKGQKPKPPTAAQQKKNAEIRAKRAKEDHRDPTEKASDGRYSDRHSNRGSD